MEGGRLDEMDSALLKTISSLCITQNVKLKTQNPERFSGA